MTQAVSIRGYINLTMHTIISYLSRGIKDYDVPDLNSIYKLDGVSPVDNRPSTVKLHHIVKKKKNCDM